MKLTEKKLKSKTIYKGKILDLLVDDVLSATNIKCTREYINHCFAVACLLKTKDNKYILEKQFRYPINKITIEIPAGKADKNETPLKALKREVLEETGYTIKNIKSLGKFYPAAAYTNEILYLYYAEVDKKDKTNFDIDEAINLVYYTKEELLEMIKNNKIDDSKTIITILKYFLK